ncbi:hypothetical protein ACIBKX_13820 [Streptomyces sp. NPDC050658]|uniref:hypothetical protein n=1 Tax=unclassified Streptomyces TaxID=2593676 RepID=UPI00344308AE
MLRRISIALAGLMAVGFLAASPAAAHGSDVHGCVDNKTHVEAGSVVVHDEGSTCWQVG